MLATSKTCTTCGATKPMDEFYKNAKAADGRQWQCKLCACEAAKASAERRKARGPIREAEAKPCSICGVVKDPGDFYPRKTSTDGLTSDCADCVRARRRESSKKYRAREAATQRRYRAENADRIKAYMDEYRQANADAIREQARRWAAANPERLRELKRAWFEANREALVERRRTDPEAKQRRLKVERDFRERHRDRVTETQRRRRVDKLGLTVADVDLDALWTGSCGICDQPLDPELRHPDPLSKSVDHIMPLARGGTHEAHNLQWAHLRCNISKGARLPEGVEQNYRAS